MPVALPPLVPLPFAEAIAWAKARGVVLPDVYYGQLQGLARAKAFSVAGIARLDQLLLIHESLNDALATGQTFAEWKKGILAKDSGLGAMPMHRLDNIFRTNIQSDYARGRCEQQGRNKERFPWLLYDAVNDSRTRPAHAAMDGFVCRHDDPVLRTWRTPNGYRCRCRWISLTEKQAQKYIDADARRLSNDKPQDHLWGLTYAQARSRAISEGPDSGWDYDICQECGSSQLDHCSGATRGIEQATDDRIRALHEVAGTPGGQALSDAATPELIAARDAVEKAAEKAPWTIIKAGDKIDTGDVVELGKLRAAEILADLPDTLSREAVTSGSPESLKAFREALIKRLGDARKLGGTVSLGDTPAAWKKASQRVFDSWPAEWVAKVRPRRVVHAPGARSYYDIDTQALHLSGSTGGSVVEHEWAHALQADLPSLQSLFVKEFNRRTAGESTKQLHKYGKGEVGKSDSFMDAYAGRTYQGAPLEFMAMVFQAVLGGDSSARALLAKMLKKDKDSLHFALGLLFHWVP